MNIPEVRTPIIIKLPFIYKNTGFNKKGLYLDHSRLKQYLIISDNCVDQLTKNFNSKNFKLNISSSLLRINKRNLALSYQNLINEGKFKNQAELARAFRVSRSWVTQVLNVLKQEKLD